MPQIRSHTAMDQNVRPNLPNIPTHTTLTSQIVIMPHQIITSQNLTPSRRPQEERDSTRSFDSPNGPPRERNSRMTSKGMVKEFYIKLPMMTELPIQRIWIKNGWNISMNEDKESQHFFNFPIIKILNEQSLV